MPPILTGNKGKGTMTAKSVSIQIKDLKTYFYLDEGTVKAVDGATFDSCQGETLGVVGEIHPQVLVRYDLPGRAYLFEIDFEQLVKGAGEGKRFRPLPKFPAVYRDLSMVVDEAVAVEKVTETI